MSTEAINDDHIDKTQFLPKGESMLTPERIAKGDLRIYMDSDCGEIREAQLYVKNILNYLLESNVIDDEMHDEAVTFQIWRDMHLASLGMKKSVSSGNQEATSIRLRAHGYVQLLRLLSRYDVRAIEIAIETSANEFTQMQVDLQRLTYRRAIQNLSIAMPPIREKIAYLESLTEEQRNELSEERLKTLVDEMKKHA